MAWLKAALAGIALGILAVLGLFIIDPPGPRQFINKTATQYPAIKVVLEDHPEIYAETRDQLRDAFDQGGNAAMDGAAMAVLGRVNPGVFFQYVVQATPAALDRSLRARIQVLRQLDQNRHYEWCNRPDVMLPLEVGSWQTMPADAASRIGEALSELIISGKANADVVWPAVDETRMRQLRDVLTPKQAAGPSLVSGRGGRAPGLVVLGDPDEADKCRQSIRFYELLSRLPMLERTAYLRWQFQRQAARLAEERPMNRLLAPVS